MKPVPNGVLMKNTNYFIYGGKLHYPSNLNKTIVNKNKYSSPANYKYYPYEASFDIDKSLEQATEDPITKRRRYFFPPLFRN